VGEDIIGRFALYLSVSALVAAPVAFALLVVFRRAVVRGQRRQETDDPSAEVRLPVERQRRSEPPTRAEADRSLASAAAVYVLAGVAFSAFFAAVMLRQSPMPPGILAKLIAFAFAFSLYTPPIVFAGWIVLPPGLARQLFIGACAALFPAMALLVIPFSEGSNVFQVLYSALTPTMAALLLLVFMARRIRATGPLVLLVVTGSIVAGNLVLDAAMLSPGAMNVLVTATQFVGAGVALGASFAIGAVVGVALVWPVLLGLGALYRRKLLSDQSLLMDVVFGWFSIFFGLLQASDGLVWALSGVAAFVAYKAVTLLGFGVLGVLRRQRPHADIVLLRPFALGRRSERLFDQLSKVWLRLGAVHMIAGPDLVMTTASPPEFLSFLAGRMSRQFIRTRGELAERLGQLDLDPDPDGRYRVNQLYCRDNVWQDAMRALTCTSGAVLMDLRGFSVANQGCSFEIAELIRNVPLSRVVFAVDETTDLAFLAHIAEDVRRTMPAGSPNAGMTDIASRVFSVDNSGRGRRSLIGAILDASAA
jgi:hypothetical protein